MSIPDHINKIKSNGGLIPLLVIILSVALGVGFGRLWGVYDARTPLSIIEPESALTPVEPLVEVKVKNDATVFKASQDLPETVGKSVGKYVASKNSTKYHLPSCPGAKQIKEENKRWFNTAEEAEQAGLVPASNCPGI